MLSTTTEATSDMLPTASMPRKETVPFSDIFTPSAPYPYQFSPSREYCLWTESSLNTAVTVTVLAGSVVLTVAMGFSGATLSMLSTTTEATSDMLPAASMPRKYTVPFSDIFTPPTAYSLQFFPSREYCFWTESALNTAVTVTS